MTIAFACVVLDGELDSPLCFGELAVDDDKLIELLVTLKEFVTQILVQSQAIFLVERSAIDQVVRSWVSDP